MPGEDIKRSIHRAFVKRILDGPGQAPVALRARAFANAELPDPLLPLLEKVARRSAQVSDADFARAAAAGFSDDQLFELVICQAVGESTRKYEAGMAALGRAIAEAEWR